MKVKQPSGSLPQTDNFAVLLVQGLESSDPVILNVSIKRNMMTGKDLYNITKLSKLETSFYLECCSILCLYGNVAYTSE